MGSVTFLNEGTDWSVGSMVFTLMVPKSARRVSKLCAGQPSSVRLRAAFSSALGERTAGATGPWRAARAPSLSSSLKSAGARASFMCQAT